MAGGKGFFEETPGNKSNGRLTSFVFALGAVVSSVIILLAETAPPDGLLIFYGFLGSSVGSKAVSKFTELKPGKI